MKLMIESEYKNTINIIDELNSTIDSLSSSDSLQDSIDMSGLREYVSSTDKDLFVDYFQDIHQESDNLEKPTFGSSNFLYDVDIWMNKNDPEYYTTRNYEFYINNLKKICENLNLDQEKIENFFGNISEYANILYNNQDDVESKQKMRMNFQFLSSIVTLHILENNNYFEDEHDIHGFILDILSKQDIYEDIKYEMIESSWGRPPEIDEILEVMLNSDRMFYYLYDEQIDYIAKHFDHNFESWDTNYEKIKQKIIEYHIDNMSKLEIESCTENNSTIITTDELTKYTEEVESYSEDIERLNQEIFKSTRVRSDRNRRQIDTWIKDGTKLSFSQMYWILHKEYFGSNGENSAWGFMASSYLTNGNGILQKASEFNVKVGGLRERNVNTAKFPHLKYGQPINIGWAEFSSAIDDNFEKISQDIRESDNYDRLAACFLSMIVGHYPLDASGRVNETALYLLSGGQVTISENGYRGFKRDIFDKLSATSHFKQQILQNVRKRMNRDITPDEFILRNPSTQMRILAEHKRIVDIIRSGEFTQDLLDDYPSINPIIEILKSGRTLKYEFLDKLDISDQTKTDQIVAKIANVESFERGEKISSIDHIDQNMIIDLYHSVSELKKKNPDLRFLDHLNERIRKLAISKPLLISLSKINILNL